jgi:hypothetical protein
VHAEYFESEERLKAPRFRILAVSKAGVRQKIAGRKSSALVADSFWWLRLKSKGTIPFDAS